MGIWSKSFWWSGGYGIILGLIQAILMMFGMSESLTLWVTSIALYFSTVAMVWVAIYQIGHAKDKDENLETALYEALDRQVKVAGSDVSSRITSKSPVQVD